MNQLRDALEEYLAVRRSLGFGLRIPASLLHNFVSFLEANEATYITRALAIRWAEQPRDAQLATWAGRLGVVRRFARWRSVTDPRTEIPPDGLLPYRYHRNPPYIYTDEEIERLLGAAAGLPSANGLKARSYLTLFGLLSVTGMRVSEALMLDRVDVDLEQGILTIRRTKFGKSRLVPVHRSTRDALESYDTQRTRVFPRPETPAFFSPSVVDASRSGARVTPSRNSPNGSACAAPRRVTGADRGFMTCATDLRPARYCNGTARGSMSSTSYPSLPPILATFT
ncbi:MAG: site-specific integrase [Gammaproteobacteria bacterium]|nr:site-specific integrase [Gammaproteobacteria bacterium]